jgi:hypothetical protein
VSARTLIWDTNLAATPPIRKLVAHPVPEDDCLAFAGVTAAGVTVGVTAGLIATIVLYVIAKRAIYRG